MDLLQIVKEYGIWAGTCLYFIAQGQIRESRMRKDYESLNKYVRSDLARVIKANTKALRIFSHLLSSRTCMAKDGLKLEAALDFDIPNEEENDQDE